MDPFFQRRKRYRETLAVLGLADAFEAMPRVVQNLFLHRKIADPTVAFDETIADEIGPKAFAELRKIADERVREAHIEVDGLDKMPVRDFLGIVTSCMLVVQNSDLRGFDESVVRFMTDARPVLEQCYAAHIHKASMELYMAVHVPLAARGRLDERLLSARLECAPGRSGKAVPRVLVRSAKAQMRQVTLKGIPRDVYRVGCGSPSGEPKWLTLKRKTLGIPGSSGVRRSLPVYVQRHALRRLHERVNLPTASPYLEAWLEDSLSKPKIVERQGSRGQHLVIEYRIGEHRFGYLVCTVMKGMIVVRTFKFLTMSCTPEGRRLEKRLKITRAGVIRLGLDALSAFTQTDLCKDPELSWMLRRCGCGHLLELKPEDYAPQPRAFAKDVKQYLKRAA